MPRFESDAYRNVEEYRLSIETFARLTSYLLFGFAKQPIDTKNTIIQNFLARTVMMVRSVMAVWDMGNVQDCWILHRSLVDRYFHLVALAVLSATSSK